eukprot:UN05580
MSLPSCFEISSDKAWDLLARNICVLQSTLYPASAMIAIIHICIIFEKICNIPKMIPKHWHRLESKFLRFPHSFVVRANNDQIHFFVILCRYIPIHKQRHITRICNHEK